MKVLLLAALLFLPVHAWAQAPAWDKLADGLEVTVWTPGEHCAQVPPLYMMKVDPERFRFAVYQFHHERIDHPLTLPEWQHRTRAVALFNAGLFLDDFSYMGMLYTGGQSAGSAKHAQWQGLFVAEPMAPTGKKARVLDLTADTFDPGRPAYQEAAQALMLLDRKGKPRVRQSGKAAQQTVVAEDRAGHILVIMTKGETALWELAGCLRDGFRDVTHAMAMDGGASSDMLISSSLAGTRAETAWQPLVDGKGLSHTPLPAVIGIFPRR